MAPEPLSLRARILLHSAIQVAGRAGNSVGGLILVAFLTRYLGPSGFGRYTFVTGYVALFYVATDLGLGSVAVRELARRPTESQPIVGALLSLKALLSVLAFLAAAIVALVAPEAAMRGPGVEPAILIAGLGLLLTPLSSASGVIFQTNIRMTIPSLAELLGRVAGVSVVALLAGGVLFPAADPALRLTGAAAATLFAGLISVTTSLWGARRLAALRPRLDPARLRRMARDGAPLAVVAVLGTIHYRLDVLILSAMQPMSVVGSYGIAVKVLDLFVGLAGLFMGLAFPVLSRRAVGDRLLLERAFRKTVEFMLIVAIGAAAGISVLAPTIVSLVGGSHFAHAALPVSIIAWAIPVIYTSSVFSYMVVAANRQLAAVPYALLAIAFNAALNVLLIPHFGSSGPALATVLSESASLAGVVIIMVRSYHFGPDLSVIARIILAGLAAVLAMRLLLPLGLLVDASVGAALYVGGIAVLGVVGMQDVRAVVGDRFMPG